MAPHFFVVDLKFTLRTVGVGGDVLSRRLSDVVWTRTKLGGMSVVVVVGGPVVDVVVVVDVVGQ